MTTKTSQPASIALPRLSHECDHDPDTLDVETARRRLIEAINPVTATEMVSLDALLGRVLATNIITANAIPPWDNSAMDGYALRAQDLPSSPTGLAIVGTSLAGHPYPSNIEPGQAVRITTGAVVPVGANTVVMQEHVQIDGAYLHTARREKTGANIRVRGEEFAAGDIVLTQGTRIEAAHIALLASLGIASAMVYRRVNVAILSTGDELKPIDTPLQTGQIYDSNRYALKALLASPAIHVHDLGCVADHPDSIATQLREIAPQVDIIITSGGVSVGEADYTKAALQILGNLDFWKIAMKPGKPLAFGWIGNTSWVGLPGNPVSAMVTFQQFLIPALHRLMGSVAAPVARFRAVCTSPLKKRPGRMEFQRGILYQAAEDVWRVRSAGKQSSSMLSSVAHANCYIVLPVEAGDIDAGTEVSVEAIPRI
jgi:molybdopterin molybdotransferase